MISLDEICKPDIFNKVPVDHQLNMAHLHYAANSLRSHYKKPLTVSSGYRTLEDHKRIYEKINVKRINDGLQMISAPMGSQHLIGSALDLYDPTFQIKNWIVDHLELAERLDIYFEDFDATGGVGGGWLHMQLWSPASGKRFFKP